MSLLAEGDKESRDQGGNMEVDIGQWITVSEAFSLNVFLDVKDRSNSFLLCSCYIVDFNKCTQQSKMNAFLVPSCFTFHILW